MVKRNISKIKVLTQTHLLYLSLLENKYFGSMVKLKNLLSTTFSGCSVLILTLYVSALDRDRDLSRRNRNKYIVVPIALTTRNKILSASMSVYIDDDTGRTCVAVKFLEFLDIFPNVRFC